MENAASPTTNRQYQQQWTSFVEFHQIIQIPFKLPSTSDTVSMFTAHLQQQGLKSSTIQTYLSAISNRHKLENLSDPTATYLVTKTLQGIKNSEPNDTQRRLPITKTILQRIILSIPFCTSNIYTQTMLRALFLLTYHACLRVGEAVHSNQQAHTLTIDHLTETHNSYQITFTSYKHSGTETPIFLLQPQADTMYCPVLALRQYLLARGQQPGPIFVDAAKTPITRDKFAHYLKLCLQLAGLSPNNYTTHSLRIGRATQLAMEGVSETIIKTTGRWKSNAYTKYIRPSCFTLPE